MRLAVVCPVCGMWVHPNRFNVLRWPIRIFRRIMGGRKPNSKVGIIEFRPMDLPEEVRLQLIWRMEELAKHLGYELKPIEHERKLLVAVAPSRVSDFVFRGVRR